MPSRFIFKHERKGNLFRARWGSLKRNRVALSFDDTTMSLDFWFRKIWWSSWSQYMIFFWSRFIFKFKGSLWHVLIAPGYRKKGLKRHDILMDTGSHTSGCSVGGLIMEELKKGSPFFDKPPLCFAWVCRSLRWREWWWWEKGEEFK